MMMITNVKQKQAFFKTRQDSKYKTKGKNLIECKYVFDDNWKYIYIIDK